MRHPLFLFPEIGKQFEYLWYICTTVSFRTFPCSNVLTAPAVFIALRVSLLNEGAQRSHNFFCTGPFGRWSFAFCSAFFDFFTPCCSNPSFALRSLFDGCR